MAEVEAGAQKWAQVAPPDLTADSLAAVRALWAATDAAFVAADGLHVVLPPGRRGFGASPAVDFAAAGKRMPPGDVQRARQQWSDFKRAAPPYPGDGVFYGRGIVLVGCAPWFSHPDTGASFSLERVFNCDAEAGCSTCRRHGSP
jgi:hypothetical protein